MFTNIGNKIKIISKIVFVLIAIGLFLSFLIPAISSKETTVIIVSILIGLPVSILCGYISSIFTYAFGELVDSNQKILEHFENNNTENYIAPKENVSKPQDSYLSQNNNQASVKMTNPINNVNNNVNNTPNVNNAPYVNPNNGYNNLPNQNFNNQWNMQDISQTNNVSDEENKQ